jgi:hypothetical protein
MYNSCVLTVQSVLTVGVRTAVVQLGKWRVNVFPLVSIVNCRDLFFNSISSWDAELIADNITTRNCYPNKTQPNTSTWCNSWTWTPALGHIKHDTPINTPAHPQLPRTQYQTSSSAYKTDYTFGTYNNILVSLYIKFCGAVRHFLKNV